MYPVQKYRIRINASLALQIFVLRHICITNFISQAEEICICIYTSTILLQFIPCAVSRSTNPWTGSRAGDRRRPCFGYLVIVLCHHADADLRREANNNSLTFMHNEQHKITKNHQYAHGMNTIRKPAVKTPCATIRGTGGIMGTSA